MSRIKTFTEYQERTMETAQYPQGEDGVDYIMLGLAGEAGEVLNKLKKVIRGDYELTNDKKLAIAYELGDVMWYVAQVVRRYRLTFKNNVVADKFEVLQEKNNAPFNFKDLCRNAATLNKLGADTLSNYYFVKDNSWQMKLALQSIMILTAMMASRLGTTIEDIVNNNYEKLTARKKIGTIKGDGDGVKRKVVKKRRKRRKKVEIQTTEQKINSQKQVG